MKRFDPELMSSRWWPRTIHHRTFLVGKDAIPPARDLWEQDAGIPHPSTITARMEQIAHNALNDRRM